MEFLKRIFKNDAQPVNLAEQKEASFINDLENLKKALKEYGLSYYETFESDSKATSSKGLGDIINEKEKAFQQQLQMMIKKYPNSTEELRDEIIRISQDEESTGIRDKNKLTNFAGEIINLLPPQSKEYSEIKNY
jgi:hypothetical protein